MAKQQETQWQRWQRIAKAAYVNWRTVRAYDMHAAGWGTSSVRPSLRVRIENAMAKLAKKGGVKR